MEESLEPSHNLPRHRRMWQASILVRALVHGWRHRGGAHMCVEGVGAAVVIGLDSCDSPSALSVPRAHSSDQSALGGVAARGVRAWCWSFFCWLPLSHGLARACLHQGWDLQVCRHPCTSALTGMLTRTCCALLVRLGDHSKHSSNESIPSMRMLSH